MSKGFNHKLPWHPVLRYKRVCLKEIFKLINNIFLFPTAANVNVIENMLKKI